MTGEERLDGDEWVGYSGANWLRSAGKPLSEFGARAADLIGWWARGIYHMQDDALRADWSDERMVTFTVGQALCTFDGSSLTRLVIGAHDRAIRVTVEAASPTRMRIRLHPRIREGEMWQRHASMEQAIVRERRS